ncbi:UNVERIFIED_CONTAM: FHA domain-containing protein [Sesamum latifolium]|uniref:FHA domain-containing protein n=1 Tax=Sesamum latifolium TaxID=2727402 RepID=A0AAW2VYG9_9LAMI
MAPRKSAAAGKDDPCPMLKLIMEKGPLSGQTSDFRPGSRIQIGRVVRGNTLAIKDLGVSSKHLLIQVEPGSDTGSQRWTITDLGSSNGTFLNDVRLEQSEPTVLSDGDVIKIGEQTSINVKFEVDGAENEVGSRNLRRNTRRRGKNQVAELVVIDEDSELGLGVGSENNLGMGLEMRNMRIWEMRVEDWGLLVREK